MEKREKRARGSNWTHAHTMALAELKREASLNKEYGRLVWERIAQTLSSTFSGQIRNGDQCRRRWDTLVKVYNHIEDYCVVTGQDHRELDQGELASMKLKSAYQPDWYDIVEQVCSQRKRKEKCDRDQLAKRSKCSHSVELPEHPPNRDSLCSASTSSKSVTYHEQAAPESTTTYAQVSFSPSLEADKLCPEEEFPRLRNGNDGLLLEATQMRQHRKVSHDISQEPETFESANLLLHIFPAENGAQLKEPLPDDIWALVDAMPLETSVEIEQSETEWKFADSYYLNLGSTGLGIESLQDHKGDGLPVTAVAQGGGMIDMHDFIRTMDRRRSWTGADRRIRILPESRRWSLKVILLKIRQSCFACGRKERVEDLEMESKQAARLKEKALMPRKENVREMLNAASPPSGTSATSPCHLSKQAALDKKEEESRSRKAPERQLVGGKSSSKCVPVGKLCAKWSRKLRFPAFHGQSSH